MTVTLMPAGDSDVRDGGEPHHAARGSTTLVDFAAAVRAGMARNRGRGGGLTEPGAAGGLLR